MYTFVITPLIPRHIQPYLASRTITSAYSGSAPGFKVGITMETKVHHRIGILYAILVRKILALSFCN